MTRPATTTALLHPHPLEALRRCADTSRRMPVGAIVIIGAVVLSGCDTAPDVTGVALSSATGSTETARGPSTAATASDPASVVIDRLLEAFNAQDADEVADVFGDDVVYVLRNTGEELVGVDATSFFEEYFGRETGERTTDPFHAPDGRTYFLSEFADPYGSSMILVFDVEMDGERLVTIGDRSREFEEVFATGEIDDLHEAFNDEDVDRLTEEFDGITYRSASGAEFTGEEAAEHWADAFGMVVTRTSGVFDIGDGAYGYVTEHWEPDTGRFTEYTVEIERADGRITSMAQRPLKTCQRPFLSVTRDCAEKR